MLKNLRTKIVAGSLLPVVMLSNSHAAVDAAVTTALSDAKADGATIAAGVFLLIFGIAVWRHLRGAK